ncbi:MAG: glycosyltransferase family 2 protein [Planctomycetes bacterium]|nr:glycosyltransferase family 2 protein [Planctomycetota bacterium]
MMSCSVSIVIPAYNEASRIVASLAEVLAFARGYAAIAEIIIVDDGSTDRTAELVEAAAREATGPASPRVALVRHPANRGKGAAVRTGFEAAHGDIVLFTDADLSTPITEAPRLIEPIAADRREVVIGSRALDASKIELHQSLFRRNAGRTFNRLVRWCTGLDLLDTQCGFKAFRRAAMAPLFKMQRIEGFAFDVELLYLAHRRGLRISELPVRWAHAHGSKVSMFVHTWEMAIDLARIRWNDLLGRYPIDEDPIPSADPRAENPARISQ